MLYREITKAKKRIKGVIVGCGEQATNITHTSLNLLDEIEIVACCDLNEDRAAFCAKRFGLKGYYTDLAKMLEEVDAEAAFVVSVPKIQGALAQQCIEAGFHVYMEKPMGLTLEECYSLRDAAEKMNKKLCISFNKRHTIAYQDMKNAIYSDEFGHPSAFIAKFVAGYRPNALDLLRTGSIHFFDIARFMIGEVEEVYAYEYIKQVGQHMYSVTMKFENGCVGTMTLGALGTWVGMGAEYLEAHGDRNFVSVSEGREFFWKVAPEILSSSNTEGQTQAIIEKVVPAKIDSPNYSNVSKMDMHSFYLNGYYQCIKDFIFAVMEDREPAAGANDGIMALKIAMAVEKSVAENRAVKISEIN